MGRSAPARASSMAAAHAVTLPAGLRIMLTSTSTSKMWLNSASNAAAASESPPSSAKLCESLDADLVDGQ